MTIKKTVWEYIEGNFFFGADAKAIDDDQSFLELGVLDSTGVIELVSFLEETYGIQVDDEEMVPENLDSLNNISRYVGGKLAARVPQPMLA
jgi:acyl carrier protein